MPTTIATRTAEATSIGLDELRHTVRLALAATDALALDHPAWGELAPHMDAFEHALGDAIGQRTSPTPSDATHVMRIRGLVVAARRLLRRDVTIVDATAAGRAAELAGVMARAGVTGIVRVPR